VALLLAGCGSPKWQMFQTYHSYERPGEVNRVPVADCAFSVSCTGDPATMKPAALFADRLTCETAAARLEERTRRITQSFNTGTTTYTCEESKA
jgi:hypothetical protein